MVSDKNRYIQLNRRIIACARCPRLRAHCEQMARVKRARFKDQHYFAKPVPNFGDPRAQLLILGLAPAAHGANRTGRMFSGDRSGDFLYLAMHKAGFANQPHATSLDDGLELIDTVITAACHCAPPDNKPTLLELENCADFLEATVDALPRVKVVLCLGRVALASWLRLARRRGWVRRAADYPFAHGAEHHPPGGPVILICYHPSQQNTFTGRLTQAMLMKVLVRARELLRSP